MKVVLAPKSAPKSWATPLRTGTPEQASPASPRAGLKFLMIIICLWINLNLICAIFSRAGLVKIHSGVPGEQKNEGSSCNLLHTTISFIHRVQKGVYLIKVQLFWEEPWGRLRKYFSAFSEKLNFIFCPLYLFVAPYRQRKFQILCRNLWSLVIDQQQRRQ